MLVPCYEGKTGPFWENDSHQSHLQICQPVRWAFRVPFFSCECMHGSSSLPKAGNSWFKFIQQAWTEHLLCMMYKVDIKKNFINIKP